MASLTWWTWIWVNSGSWWWTGRPGMLRFMRSQRVRHDWVTEPNWTEYNLHENLFNLVTGVAVYWGYQSSFSPVWWSSNSNSFVSDPQISVFLSHCPRVTQFLQRIILKSATSMLQLSLIEFSADSGRILSFNWRLSLSFFLPNFYSTKWHPVFWLSSSMIQTSIDLWFLPGMDNESCRSVQNR